MSLTTTTITLSAADLEVMIRRVVREELRRVVQPSEPIIDDEQNALAEDDLDEDDRSLLQEALAVREQYKDQPDAWMDLDDFIIEVKRAEVASELPS